MNEVPSRSKIFRSSQLDKPKEVDVEKVAKTFSKLLYRFNEKSLSEVDIKGLCEKNGYNYVIADGFYYIYDPKSF